MGPGSTLDVARKLPGAVDPRVVGEAAGMEVQ